jgi:hypothetical protein
MRNITLSGSKFVSFQFVPLCLSDSLTSMYLHFVSFSIIDLMAARWLKCGVIVCHYPEQVIRWRYFV